MPILLVAKIYNRFSKTNMSYGVNEVLLASVLGAGVFAILAAQPLVIVGVTGRCFNDNIDPDNLSPIQGQLPCSTSMSSQKGLIMETM
jgi:HCO3- transporter family